MTSLITMASTVVEILLLLLALTGLAVAAAEWAGHRHRQRLNAAMFRGLERSLAEAW